MTEAVSFYTQVKSVVNACIHNCTSTVVSQLPVLTKALGKTGNGARHEVSTPLTAQPWSS